MKTTIKNITLALSILTAATVPMALKAQSGDSILTRQSSLNTGLNIPRSAYGNTGKNGAPANNYNSFLKSISTYKLNLTNGFSLKTTEGLATMSNVNTFNPTNFRRENFMPREELLYGQRFSLGASYNGLNNMVRGGGFGGGGGMSSRNPGLSLHAGISF